MNKIKIITDESAILPKVMLEKYEVGLVSLKIIWGEEEIRDDLFQKMRSTLSDTAPKTSQPSVGDFKKAYEEAFKEHNEIICLTLSSALSGTYNSALQAIKFLPKEKQDRITLIDTFTVDSAHGLILLKVCELREAGFNVKEIVSKIEEFKENLDALGFAGDPKWLEKNGRLSKAGANIIRQVSKLGVRPLLTIKEGKVAVTSIKLKAKDKTEAILRELKERIGDKEAVVAITHGDALKTALVLKEKLGPNMEVLFIEEITPVIGCHLGPDGIICSYFLKENDVL